MPGLIYPTFLNQTNAPVATQFVSLIEITNPWFWLGIIFMAIIFIYCIYLIYFAFSIKIQRQKYDYFPSVSVMVDVKNAGNTVRRRIENLLNQNYPRKKYEIIVYDRNSKDETGKICREYEKKGLIKYVRGKSEIKGPLLDSAIKKYAKGGILIMTDPDVIGEKDWILDFVQPFKDKSVGAVAGTIHCGNYYKGFFPLMRAIEDEWRFVAPILRNSDTIVGVGAAQALRKEAWQQTKYGNALLDDYDINSRIIDEGWKTRGVSATGVEEEVETLRQYWKQRTRWYKVDIGAYLSKTKHWKKFLEALPHSIQLIALINIFIFILSLIIASKTVFWLSVSSFALLNMIMAIAFVKTRTGQPFIWAIPLYLTIDTFMFAVTAAYIQTFGRFIHVTKEVWPTLKGHYYHAGSELRDWYFKFEDKAKDFTKI